MKFRAVHLAVAAVLVLAGCANANSVQFQSVTTGPLIESVKITGLLFKPTGEGVHPAVVLLHTCGGMQPHVTELWPDYLTELGYVVLSVDSYGPRGVSRCSFGGIGWKEQADDAYGALDYLIGLPFVDGNRVGVMGFSRGAMAINDDIIDRILNEGDPDFKAAIAFYGRCTYIRNHTEESVPLMEIVAENDSFHAPSCIDVGKKLPIEVHVLKGAYHAFDVPQFTSFRNDSFGTPMLYDAAKTREARELTRAFLAKHL